MKNLLLQIVILILSLWNLNSACAKDTFANDFGSWTEINFYAPITEKVQTRFHIIPRLLDNATDFNELGLHGLLGYKFNEYFSFYQGYAWNTLYIPNFTREQRPYQEAIISHEVDKLQFQHRIRFEERFLQGVDGVSLRGRYRLKGTYPLDKNKKWSLVLFDELLINFNSPNDGPKAGINQNRIYAGINRRLNENISADLGYQLQHRHFPGPATETLNHFIIFYLNYSLPTLVQNK
ncbi:MAG: hypothetical protein A3B68_05025 [Candidatus Melainabacteria bacterium RIFCSPHIGHO2_02_FULL_34_12]|nr:MAG: hypothetical protein A3B68_05025 [Candidatus Melainabacteria bacterium RIFCSPHIGHO2_02_FULL_34_12]